MNSDNLTSVKETFVLKEVKFRIFIQWNWSTWPEAWTHRYWNHWGNMNSSKTEWKVIYLTLILPSRSTDCFWSDDLWNRSAYGMQMLGLTKWLYVEPVLREFAQDTAFNNLEKKRKWPQWPQDLDLAPLITILGHWGWFSPEVRPPPTGSLILHPGAKHLSPGGLIQIQTKPALTYLQQFDMGMVHDGTAT